MIHDDTARAKNRKGDLADINQLMIILAAPSYDYLTGYTSKLLENFPDLGAPTVLCKIERPLTYDELLSQHSIDPLVTDVVLIFCGHGEKNSLLGPGTQTPAPDQRGFHSSFFDESHVPIGPKFLLAFCPNAAAELGRAYECMTYERTFVGFDSEIGFMLEEGVYADCWRKLLHGLALAMLSAPDVVALESAVKDLYEEVFSFFSTGEGRELQWSLMMRMLLLGQKQAINFFRT
jgi:hypothetical protein